MNRLFKSIGAGALHYGGGITLLEMWGRAHGTPTLTIIGYHRVVEEPLETLTSSPHGMVVSAGMFEQQIAYLARRYRVLSLAEVVDRCERGIPFPPRSCLISFDDGWRDNYTVAFPILVRHGLPATIMLTTDYIGTTNRFWYTRLIPIVLSKEFRAVQNGDELDPYPDPIGAELVRLRTCKTDLRTPHLNPLIEIMKRYPNEVIEAVISGLAARFGCPDPHAGERMMLDWDEVREMVRSGITMGSHSRSHRILTQLSDREVVDELRGSKTEIEKRLGRPVESIAFPNGNCTDALIKMVWEVGYRVLFLSAKRANLAHRSHRVFPAVCIDNGSSAGLRGEFSASRFSCTVSGAAGRLGLGR